MSKIFDALKKSQDRASDPILSSLADEPAEQWGRPAEEHDPAPEPVLSSPVDEPLPSWARRAVEHVAAPTAVAEPDFGFNSRDDLRIRTLPIQVTSNVPILPFDGTHPAAAEQYRLARTRII